MTYFKFSKKVDLKHSYHTRKVTMWGDECVISQCFCILNHHIIHIKNYVVQSRYMWFLFVNYTSIKLGKKKKHTYLWFVLGPTVGNYKGFTGQAHRGQLSPQHTRFGTASVLQSQKGIAFKVSSSSGQPCNIYISNPGTFIPKSL